ncbi:MAG TPA: MMPL family transporter [Solirubrobacteraceae bacterium]|nr:MMPL family transporter [Solirubrobacteraceae bacterium]
MLKTIARWAGGRRAKWYVVGFWLLLFAVSTLPGQLTEVTEDRISSFLPDDADAIVADKVIEERFPGGQTTSAVAVYHREGGLTDADQQTILSEAEEIAGVEFVLPPVAPFEGDSPEGLVSEDGTTAFTVIPINAARQQDINALIEDVREVANGGSGLTAEVTGPAALETDLRHAFESADVTLLLVTGLLVLGLLLLIYRSPLLAVIPLVVVVIAYVIASGVIKVFADSGLQVTSISTSLLLVLMFGAGTDYCLLLVARYVEELHTHEDKHQAIRIAVPRAAPAIMASAGTVIAAMLVLIFAELASTRTVGPVNAIGIFIVMAASLTLLPAILAIVGRRGFWPSKRAVFDPTFVPDEAPEQGDSRWARLGRAVTRRPVFTIGAVVAVFLVGSIGITQYDEEATMLGAFRNATEGTDGYDTLKASFPEGALGPSTVIIDRRDGPIQDADIAAAQDALRDVPDIGTLTEPFAQSEDGRAAAFNVAFPDDPYSNAALDRTDEMRDALAPLGPELEGYVGGVSAIMGDYRDGAQRDAQLVVPLVLLVIFLTLIALLRALVAPLYLIGSVILSFFGIFGVCLVFFTTVLDESGFDPSLAIFGFIFLVALGVDYNIFLMDRVREEAERIGTRRGALRALVTTGPVITSAGIILAGTFAVLAMLPITILVELGTVVAFGVLVDTFVVRSILVPAIITVVGDRSWWPSRLARSAGPAAEATAEAPRPKETV